MNGFPNSYSAAGAGGGGLPSYQNQNGQFSNFSLPRPSHPPFDPPNTYNTGNHNPSTSYNLPQSYNPNQTYNASSFNPSASSHYPSAPSQYPSGSSYNQGLSAAVSGAQRMAQTTIKNHFPDFERGKRLSMLEYVYAKPLVMKGGRKRKALGVDVRYKTQVVESLEEQHLESSATPPEQRATLLSWAETANLAGDGGSWLGRQVGRRNRQREKERERDDDDNDEVMVAVNATRKDGEKEKIDKSMKMNVLANWERDIIWDEPPLRARRLGDDVGRYAVVNEELEKDDWLEKVIWDEVDWEVGDPSLIMARQQIDAGAPLTEPNIAGGPSAHLQPGEITHLDYLNLSLDHHYQPTREIKQKIRQTIDALDIQHATPALRLQMPYYPVYLTKTQQRSWHRPRIRFPTDEVITFDGLKKKMESKKDKAARTMNKSPSEVMKTAKDLTLAEKGKFVLLEFSEQHPPIMSGFGMGSNLITYYRKGSENDEFTRPEKDALGEFVVLDPSEQEPIPLLFMAGGRVQQTLVNNLIRAPLYEHSPSSTDFLVIRSTVEGESTYHIREIPHLFVVGQTLPHKAAVPGVKSKDMGAYKKERLLYLIQTALRLNGGTLETGQITRYYQDRDAGKLKEYLTTDRDDMWRPRTSADATNPNYKVYADAIARNNPTPEHAVLLEAHDVAARLLSDMGYYVPETAKEDKEEAAEDEGADDETQLEMQLAAWKITRNYIKDPWHLRLEAKGNPTGKEFEGYDLRRTVGPTKGVKRRPADVEDYTWRWQSIFLNQMAALAAPDQLHGQQYEQQAAAAPAAPRPDIHMDDEDRKPMLSDDDEDAEGEYEDEDEDMEGGTDRGQSYEPNARHGNDDDEGKVLQIMRTLADGSTQTEYVRDPRVINAYILQKKRLRISTIDIRDSVLVDQILDDPTEDPQIRNMLAERVGKTLRKTKANLDRRMKASGQVPKKRRALAKCRRCGGIGHTSAQKRNCPANEADWAKYKPDAGAQPKSLKLKVKPQSFQEL